MNIEGEREPMLGCRCIICGHLYERHNFTTPRVRLPSLSLPVLSAHPIPPFTSVALIAILFVLALAFTK